jgi:hypothetical protein
LRPDGGAEQREHDHDEGKAATADRTDRGWLEPILRGGHLTDHDQRTAPARYSGS